MQHETATSVSWVHQARQWAQGSALLKVCKEREGCRRELQSRKVAVLRPSALPKARDGPKRPSAILSFWGALAHRRLWTSAWPRKARRYPLNTLETVQQQAQNLFCHRRLLLAEPGWYEQGKNRTVVCCPPSHLCSFLRDTETAPNPSLIGGLITPHPTPPPPPRSWLSSLPLPPRPSTLAASGCIVA